MPVTSERRRENEAKGGPEPPNKLERIGRISLFGLFSDSERKKIKPYCTGCKV